MTTTEAAKLLELPETASAEQIEARFHELRAKFEDKIAKAPTPGLKAKYRENLEEITQAFEILALAADSSELPVLKKQSAASDQPSAAGPPLGGGPESARTTGSPQQTKRSSARKPGSGREFLVVAIVAVLVLAGGGWLILKIRADNAEKARIAAAQKAEAEHQAQLAQQAAAAKLLAEQQEKEKAAAAAKAEQERLDKLAADVRVKLAEAKLSWDRVEREERDATAALTDLKSEERSARDMSASRRAELAARIEAQTNYHRWLADFTATHPARRLQVRATELLNARQIDEAEAAVKELNAALAKLDTELAAQRSALLDLDGELSLTTGQDVSWKVTDAFDRVQQGQGSARLRHVALGQGRVTLRQAGWPDRTETFLIRRSAPTDLAVEFSGLPLSLTSSPAGAEVWELGGGQLGVTPLKLTVIPGSSHTYEFRLAGHFSVRQLFKAPTNGPAELSAALPAEGSGHLSYGILFLPITLDGYYTVTTIRPGSAADTAGTIKVGDKVLAVGIPGRLTELTGKSAEEADKIIAALDIKAIGSRVAFRIQRPGESSPREIEIPLGLESGPSLMETVGEIERQVQAAGLNPRAPVAILSPLRGGSTTLAPVAYSDIYAIKRLLDHSRGQLVAFLQIGQNSIWQISWSSLALSPQGVAEISGKGVNEQLTFAGGSLRRGPSIARIMNLGENAAQPMLDWWRSLRLSSSIGADLDLDVQCVVLSL